MSNLSHSAEEISVFRTGIMIVKLRRVALSLREFLAPSYHPERHYMRGPGPACARRR